MTATACVEALRSLEHGGLFPDVAKSIAELEASVVAMKPVMEGHIVHTAVDKDYLHRVARAG